jgi:cytochrome c oxidase subunit 4
MSSHKIISVRTYLGVFVALMALTALTIITAHVDLGHGNLFAALAIAVIKASLVATYFMHLRYGTKMSRAILIAGVMGVLLMMILSIDDVRTRTTRTFLPYIGALNGVRPPTAPVPPKPPLE